MGIGTANRASERSAQSRDEKNENPTPLYIPPKRLFIQSGVGEYIVYERHMVVNESIDSML